jgi:hypothetical protein
LPLLRHILGTAHVSGSIAYWGRCEALRHFPDFPALRYPSNDTGSPLEVLREAFAKDDPNMEVTQESNGLIRMFETDVPMDILNIKIHHLSFGAPDEDRGIFNGPNDAVYDILSSPEVKTYRSAHKIGPFEDSWPMFHGGASKEQVSGDLYNVTVKEALDYILKTFPGFWIYQNCRNDEGEPGRTIHIGFYRTNMPWSDKSTK